MTDFNPEEWCWVRWPNGIRYYNKKTNKPISKNRIPPESLDSIQEKDKLSQAQDYYFKIQKIEQQIRVLRKSYKTDAKTHEKLQKAFSKHTSLKEQYHQFPEEIRNQVSPPLRDNGFYTTDAFDKPKVPKPAPKKAPRRPFEETFGRPSGGRPSGERPFEQAFGESSRRNFFNEFFGGSSTGGSRSGGPPPLPTTTQKDIELLKKFKIVTKKDWKEWMKQNHPDKNPDANLQDVQEVNAAANRIFYQRL